MLKPTHIDIFSGLGGFSKAAEWAGFETVAFSEINDWCVDNALAPNWPTVPNLGDITKLDTTTNELKDRFGAIDLLSSGTPCQPASIIGKRLGSADSRWLWPDTLRIIEYFLPRWVVCENPTGLLTLDNGDRFAEILERFHEAGYDCLWQTLPATAVGAGHRRERVFLVAHLRGSGMEGHSWNEDPFSGQHDRETEGPAGPASPEDIFPAREGELWWKNKSPVEVMVAWDKSPAFWKQAVIATGNAIVPQVAYQIIRGLTLA